jgi:hypothetical protein
MEARMSARGWGVLVALGAVVGAGIGIAVGEPSAGMLLGLGVGIAAAALIGRRGAAGR